MFFSQSSSEESVDTFFKFDHDGPTCTPAIGVKTSRKNQQLSLSNVKRLLPAMTIPASMACALLCAYWAGRLSVPGTPPVD